eukprot:TRINITY_DN90206_c0_g1_i1.p1 TRINITY_DN90206_c0_g1~~TRINITY_DN90206_c0_g1_i1.p1  ORF type:complete len:267 (+),score=58.23 TRINITY_DN90206_c0_g1_i1:113-802(+)
MSGAAALIFLHGSGDSGPGIRAWLAEASGGSFERRLESAGISLVFPSAPATPYSLIGGAPQTVWFDRVAMAYEAPEDVAGIKRSVEQVDQEIDKLLASGIPLSKIGVAGFSMGACLALHVGYGVGRHAGKMAMVASLSTFLAQDSSLDAAAKTAASAAQPLPPLVMAHGADDPMIRLPWAQATHKRLLAASVPVPKDLIVYQGLGHELCAESVQLVTDFALRHLGDAAK